LVIFLIPYLNIVRREDLLASASYNILLFEDALDAVENSMNLRG